MKKWIALVAVLVMAAAIAASCESSPVSTASTNNPSVKVELLFEHDGVKVYRFMDGRYHYYAVPSNGGGATVSEDIKSGKTSSEDELPTLERRDR